VSELSRTIQNEVHDAVQSWGTGVRSEFKSARRRATLLWCAGLLLGGAAAWLLGVAQPAFAAVSATCVLAAAAAYARPAFGCLVALPIWVGAAATYLVLAGDGE
jgi:hypothetical protein